MRVVAAIVTVLAAAAAPASAAPGDLDPSFGGGAGWVRTLEIRDATNNFLPARSSLQGRPIARPRAASRPCG
jgi:hypothetical protein